MDDKFNQELVDAKRAEYLRGLFDRAVGGDLDAGDELSKIALGGFPMAQNLVNQMDARLTLKTKPTPVISEK